MDKDFGQTATRQINNLDSLTEKLAEDMNCNTSDLWTIKNGYVITNEKALYIRWILIFQIAMKMILINIGKF